MKQIKLKPKREYLKKWGLEKVNVGLITLSNFTQTKYAFFGRVLNYNYLCPIFNFDGRRIYAFSKKWFMDK